MKRSIFALALVVPVFVACGGDGDSASEGAELRDAVQSYSDAYLTGDADSSYELLSQRCQDRHDINEWTVLVNSAASAYGEALEFTTYDAEINGDQARVTYRYQQSEIDQAQEPWVHEDGWRQDDC